MSKSIRVFIILTFLMLVTGCIGHMPKESIPYLTNLLDNNDPNVRAAAVDALRTMGPDAIDALPAIISAFGDEDEDVRWRVVTAATAFGDKAAPYCIEAIKSDNPKIMADAIWVIKKIGEPSLPYLFEAVEGADLGFQLKILEIYNEIKPFIDDEFIFRPMREARWDCPGLPLYQAIGSLCEDPVPFAPILVDGLANKHCYQQLRKIILGIGPETIPALSGGLYGETEDQRYFSAYIMAEFGAESIPYFIEALESDDPLGREGGAQGLSLLRSSDNTAMPALVKSLDDPNPITRTYAVRAMGKLELCPELVDAYAKALHDENHDVRESAALSLWNFSPPPNFVNEVAPLMNHPDAKRRVSYARLLGNMGPECIPVLLNYLDDEDFDVRRNVIFAIGWQEAAAVDVLPTLREIAENDEREEVRIAATKVIAKIEKALENVPTTGSAF